MHKFIFIALLAFVFACNNSKEDTSGQTEDPPFEKDTIPTTTSEYKYGFNLDSFIVKTGVVKENQTLSHIMLPHGINQVQCNKCYVKAKDTVIGMNFIVPGHKYTALYNLNDSSHAEYIIYEKNAIDYVVFDLSGSQIKVSKHKKKVDSKTREASGIIQSSLWNAFIDQGLKPELLMRVVNIYQWSVDFFRIQPGDYYKIIYEERSVNGKIVNSGKIHALAIHTFDSSYYAIPFTAGDSIRGYFDGEGGSLRKALLKAPLDYIRISSHFSHSRLHPVLKYRRPHLGVDYAAPSGTPVMSVGDGTVLFAGWGGGGGNTIKIQHNGNIKTYYLHLRKMHVKRGDHVIQGQQIGEVGSTGLSTGPHLDYRLEINGKKVDPINADIPTSEPLPDVLVPIFMKKRDSLVTRLQQIPVPKMKIDSLGS